MHVKPRITLSLMTGCSHTVSLLAVPAEHRAALQFHRFSQFVVQLVCVNSIARGLKVLITSLCSALVRQPGVPCPVLGFPTQERH